MIRRSGVAGSFYPGSRERLFKTLESFFNNLEGLPEPEKHASIGGLSPHAGYPYSGQVATYMYAEFRKQLPDTFIVLGPNHLASGSVAETMTSGSWETPLGELRIDEPLAKEIYNTCGILGDETTARPDENSIEVQLPFIQYIGGKKFVPIYIGIIHQENEVAAEIGTAIAEASSDRNVGIVASSDLTHFGAGYGFQPVREEPLQWMEKVDKEILAGIEKMSPEIVYAASKKTTACGYGCISAMITACEKLGLKTPEILEYRTSYDVSRDTSFVVGYGAAVIK
jgi:AmmeMemoRadiSam system protein B